LWYNLGSVSDAAPCFLSTEHVLHSLCHLDVVVVVVLNGLQTLRQECSDTRGQLNDLV
jgi:hypothetical protein